MNFRLFFFYFNIFQFISFIFLNNKYFYSFSVFEELCFMDLRGA